MLSLVLVELAVHVTPRLAACRRCHIVAALPSFVSDQKIAAIGEAAFVDAANSMAVAELTLPAIVYHSVQMVVASLLMPLIRLPPPPVGPRGTDQRRDAQAEGEARGVAAEAPSGGQQRGEVN